MYTDFMLSDNSVARQYYENILVSLTAKGDRSTGTGKKLSCHELHRIGIGNVIRE
jgi:hypothetical protein